MSHIQTIIYHGPQADLVLPTQILKAEYIRWQLVEDPVNRPRPDLRYDLANQRLKDLGWSQNVSLEESLGRIVKERVSRSAHR